MGRWMLAIIVSLLVSWFPASLGNVHPTDQTQTQSSAFPVIPVVRKLTEAETQAAIFYGRRNVADQCRTQPSIMWCAGYREYQEPLTEDIIKDMDTRVRANFTYLADTVDNWRAHTRSVIQTTPWQGDCDDLSSTTLELMARTGQPLDRMWLVLVAAQMGNRFSGRLDHLVAITEDDQGRFWVVGDTSGEVYPVEDMKYRVLAYMSTNDMVWIAAEPNDNFAERFGIESWLDRWLVGSGDGETPEGELTGQPLPDEVP